MAALVSRIPMPARVGGVKHPEVFRRGLSIMANVKEHVVMMDIKIHTSRSGDELKVLGAASRCIVLLYSVLINRLRMIELYLVRLLHKIHYWMSSS